MNFEFDPITRGQFWILTQLHNQNYQFTPFCCKNVMKWIKIEHTLLLFCELDAPKVNILLCLRSWTTLSRLCSKALIVSRRIGILVPPKIGVSVIEKKINKFEFSRQKRSKIIEMTKNDWKYQKMIEMTNDRNDFRD